ncbi:hypothetical protein KKJ01_09690 [Xenorhabdus bovienii]|uniref:Uncharacterized protein n=1 Tax=Xenorhabdus bovienii TaxID=40576 RepID=A0AAJ1MZ84_XENBV|nr:hypothetical protein [Xenorhabdus bovienii]MDE1478495.1 hypothetical protein [Xenorhabdus bovienii]MDE9510213.1 hypothetical protein [Xenorhabdus bovienii]MDE9521854.1 hypothetical protein [Xenorhabdus bovienii]
MKKLFKLKEWFTLEETARRLTGSFEEEISIADCLQLALDGHITLSVKITDECYYVAAKKIITTYRELLFTFRETKIGEDEVCPIFGNHWKAEHLDAKFEHLKQFGTVKKLDAGIYDLPMEAAERLDVEYLHSVYKGIKTEDIVNVDGPLLKKNINDDVYFNVMDVFHNSKIGWELNDGVICLYDKKKKHFITEDTYHSSFYPADTLGDVEFVFRRENIEKFEQSVLNDGEPTLALDDSLLVIGSMLSALKKAKPESKRWTQDALKGELEKTCPIGAHIQALKN